MEVEKTSRNWSERFPAHPNRLFSSLISKIKEEELGSEGFYPRRSAMIHPAPQPVAAVQSPMGAWEPLRVDFYPSRKLLENQLRVF